MSVKTNVSNRRSVEMEFEVPGTPEQIWRAIATGPGISSWLFPTEVEEREGGAVAFHIGPGMESAGTVTVWEPPRRFAYEEPDWNPGAPPLGTEFIIETRAGGQGVVRLVHSLFTSSEEWDDQFDSFESGWPGFFRVLALVLAHFPDQSCSPFRVMGATSQTETEAWNTLVTALDLKGARPGEHRRAPGSNPPLSGVVERLDEGEKGNEILMRLDEPAPGVCLAGTFSWDGKVQVALSFFLFGEAAPAAAASAEPAWTAWLKETFPAGGEETAAS